MTNLKKKAAVWKQTAAGWILFLPSLLLLYFIVWRPIVSGVGLSFFELKGYNVVGFAGFKNYIRVLTDTLFLKTLWNTVKYVLWSLLIGYLTPLVLALMLDEVIHAKSVFKFLTYLPSVLPSVAVFLIWYFLFLPGDSGVLNGFLTKLGLPTSQWLQNPNLTIPLIVFTSTWKGCGGTAIIYLASLQTVDRQLYEAANMEGASTFSKFRHITLPHISGMMMLMLVKQIITVFQIMIEPLSMTDGGPNNESVSLALQSYNYAFRYFQTGNALALSVITFVILLVLTMFYFKLNKKFTE